MDEFKNRRIFRPERKAVKAGAYLFVLLAKFYLGEKVKDKGWYCKTQIKKFLQNFVGQPLRVESTWRI
jgi:hypothetical protein